MNFRDGCFFLSSESRPSVFVGPFVVAKILQISGPMSRNATKVDSIFHFLVVDQISSKGCCPKNHGTLLQRGLNLYN